MVSRAVKSPNLSFVLQQPRPILLLELGLAQDHLDIAVGVVDLALLGVNLGEQIQFDLVRDILGVRVALEGHLRGLDVEFHIFLRDVWNRKREVDIVAGGVRFRAALGPQNYIKVRTKLRREVAAPLLTAPKMRSAVVGVAALPSGVSVDSGMSRIQ